MLTTENGVAFMASDDTAIICEMLRKGSEEYRTGILEKICPESLDYIYSVALVHEHYEVCRVIQRLRLNGQIVTD